MAYDRKPRPYSIRIGRAAKNYMLIHDISQAKVASAIGREQPYVSERLNGKRSIDTDILDAIADLSGITPVELIVKLNELSRRDDAP